MTTQVEAQQQQDEMVMESATRLIVRWMLSRASSAAARAVAQWRLNRHFTQAAHALRHVTDEHNHLREMSVTDTLRHTGLIKLRAIKLSLLGASEGIAAVQAIRTWVEHMKHATAMEVLRLQEEGKDELMEQQGADSYHLLRRLKP